MKLPQRLSCAAMLAGSLACVAFSGCGNAEPNGSAASASAIAVTPPPPSSGPAVLTPDGPPTKPGIEPRVKAEVDARADGITGAPLAVTGARASLQTAPGWKTTPGAIPVVTSGDEKVKLAASAFATEGASGKLPAVETALGLATCTWNPAEPLTIGAAKLAGLGADGTCMLGTATVRTAYVAAQNEGLIVVGAWKPDADAAGVFGSMRSITKAATTGGDAGIGPCCAALRQNANSAPLDQKSSLLIAAGVCDSLRSSPQGRAALGQVRAALRGAKMPSSCM